MGVIVRFAELIADGSFHTAQAFGDAVDVDSIRANVEAAGRTMVVIPDGTPMPDPLTDRGGLHVAHDPATGSVTVEYRRANLGVGEHDGGTVTEDLTVALTVDGADAGTLALTDGTGRFDLDGDPGPHEVTVSADGVTPATVTVEV